MRTISHGFGVSVCLPILCPSAAQAVGGPICALLNHISFLKTYCIKDIHHGAPGPALRPAYLCISLIRSGSLDSLFHSYFCAAAKISDAFAFSIHFHSIGVPDFPYLPFTSFPISLSLKYFLQKSPTSPPMRAPIGAIISANNLTNGERLHLDTFPAIRSAVPLSTPVTFVIVSCTESLYFCTCSGLSGFSGVSI